MEHPPTKAQPVWIWILSAFFIWIWCFHHFLSGKLCFTSDAVSYYNHIKFFIDQILKGVYPLWNPYFYDGVPNEFFLRRFGSFNPFYLIIAGLRLCGMPPLQAYTSFLALYWLTGAVGFYVLCRGLLRDQRSAFLAFLIFYFSAIATRLFDSYILLVLIPMVWFFAFLVWFFRTQRAVCFIGMTFCLMLLATTYIPLYFGVILIVWGLLFALLFLDQIPRLVRIKTAFLRKKWGVVLLCMVVLGASLMPGIAMFHKAQAGSFVMPARSYAAHAGKALTVSKATVTSWAILEEFVYAAAFRDLTQFKFAVVYFPGFAFVLFFLGLFCKMNRRLLFYFLGMFTLFLLGTPGLTGVYSFLQEHISVFHYFRNLHWFLWLGILPLFVLFVGAQADQLFALRPEAGKKRKLLILYMTVMHVLFYVLLRAWGPVLPWTLACLIGSWMFWTGHLLGFFQNRAQLAFLCLLLITTVQPVAVYGYLSRNSDPVMEPYKMNLPYEKHVFTKKSLSKILPKGNNKPALYYALPSYNQAYIQLDYPVFYAYSQHMFLAYDAVLSYTKDQGPYPWAKLEDIMARRLNIAVVRSPKGALPFPKQAGPVPVYPIEKNSDKFQLQSFGPNKIILTSNFPEKKFLVMNNAYDPHWQAQINGTATMVYRTNGAFQGIVLPAGKNRVVWTFGKKALLPKNLGILAVFYITFLWLLGSAVWARRKSVEAL